MSKCVACGYEYQSGSKKLEIRTLLFSKKDKTRKILTKAAQCIMKNVPSDNKEYKFYAFVKYIVTMEDEVITHTTKIYLNHDEYKKGKGFAYLRGMIQNANKDYKVKRKAELKLLGKTPKNIKNKRKELGYANRDDVSS